MSDQFQVPQGTFRLQRFPLRPRELLQAWDAADEYLLRHLAECPPSAGQPLAVFNDAFGALGVALASHRPWLVSDSYLSLQATGHNYACNGLRLEELQGFDSLATLPGRVDLALFKAPKILALLEDQLIRLRPLLHAESRVVVAGMVKGLAPSVWALLERLLGPVQTSLAWKKARLLQVRPDLNLATPASPYPSCYPLEGSVWRLCNHANLFSRQQLDIGTRLFLQHLPTLDRPGVVVDLGCGNGVVGLMARRLNPQAEIHFVDESYMAVASARDNWQRAFPDDGRVLFQVADGLEDYSPGSVALVLCNPPFHQQSTVGDHIALRLFRQSQRALQEGGELWIVGNRHLGYHQRLAALFGNVQLVASDRKFVVLRAHKAPAVKVRRGTNPRGSGSGQPA